MLYQLTAFQCRNFDLSSRREWLLTNGIGGFAMGTVAGCNTRRYHGLLVAANPAPAHRTVLLANLEAHVTVDGAVVGLSTNQYQGAVHPEGYQYLEKFEVGNFARWLFRVDGAEIEKRVALHPGTNAVTIVYRNIGKSPFSLTLRPLVQHKFYHSTFRQSDQYPQVQAFPNGHTCLEHEGQSLILIHPGAVRTPTAGWYYRFEFNREIERGLDGREDMYCPCELDYHLAPGEEAVLVASDQANTPAWSNWQMEAPSKSFAEALRAASARFCVESPTRTSTIAGYPWFTDWGRDTMISLPGIYLCTDRVAEAKKIIDDYASQIQDGLIPNRFVEEGETAEYNTVDATLWFVNAIYKILLKDWDEAFARRALGYGREIFARHTEGTRYNIKVDPEDGLLSQGENGVQLTWMDAKVGDWVVTPRHGKPVEINGLWINALRVWEWLAGRLEEDESAFREAAEKAEASFEKAFWKESLGFYLDTVGPEDGSLRPNQLIAMAVPFSPCDPEHAKRALAVISQELLTPAGLRTLGPGDANYRGQFRGDLPTLDAAYHQGTVWPWLMGPYISALIKFTGNKTEARRILKGGRELLTEYGIGGIAEVYDGDEPRSPGGCPWQAWSVAEWLRAWVEDCEGT